MGFSTASELPCLQANHTSIAMTIIIANRHPEAKERPKPMTILNRLHELNISQLDLEDEKLTKLGDSLSTSEWLYTDLQELYITNNE